METETKLQRIAWLSKRDPNKVFDCVMHHVNMESLRNSFDRLDGKKAIGIDGISKENYGKNLTTNLNGLLERMKKMAYRPSPVKEVLIEKEGQPGKYRPLGISVLEDKIVQRVFQQILESVYEPNFLDCSYGFRPGRSCHTAIQALHDYLYHNDVETVIDIDLKNFFGTIDHKILEGFIREKIKDERFNRYIIRMFKAGVLSQGELRITDEGVPQGSICSPILANIFAHHVIDKWVEEMIQPFVKGKVKLFRYADDGVICCQYEADAHAIRKVLPKRLEKYKLQLNEEKTTTVPFSRRKVQKGIEQGTFDFLGFTFYWGKSRNGRIIPKLKTSKKRMISKLGKVESWINKVRCKIPLKEIWKTFCAKVRGHTQYYGVSFNITEVYTFHWRATRIVFKWLNRRSQKKSFTWEQFRKYRELYPLPKPKICHKLF